MMEFLKYGSHKSLGILMALAVTLIFFSCDDDSAGEEPTSDFERTAMLESVADNLIIPNFETLQASVATLSEAVNAFTLNSTEENLVAARTAWVQAVTDHQHCTAFEFGPAELFAGTYAEVIGAFPVSEANVEANMLNPGFDLANSFARDVRGFFTVEYLIYGNGQSDADIVAGFSEARKDYLLLVMNEIKTTVDNIVSEWNTTYRTRFVGSNETSAGSPISRYYNGFVKDYENLKNFKLELPAGLTAEQEGPEGDLVEALYSGISRDLVVEHFQSSLNIWDGLTRSGTQIVGFDDYLDSVVGGPELITATRAAIGDIEEAIANLPEGRLSDNVGRDEVRILVDELQSNTANFKSSVVSLLGLTITFDSGDGD
ncbi:MAG: imelysin family protein [Bacteroidota bacterium]